MARECFYCKKRVTTGGHITRRGLAKKKGGIGMHVVKNVKRKFRPNLQPCRVKVGTTLKRVKVCTACIRGGKVEKAI